MGNSLALKGEAATAVLDPTRLRPVLLQVHPGECPVRWRGLFVVATAAAATNVPLVPLTIPHPLAEDEFRGALRFGNGVAGSLAPGQAAMVSLDVTNGSTQRWYGTCSSPAYPVGVAVEGRRSPAAPWTLVGEVLLTDDLPAGATAQVAVEITAPRAAGRVRAAGAAGAAAGSCLTRNAGDRDPASLGLGPVSGPRHRDYTGL